MNSTFSDNQQMQLVTNPIRILSAKGKTEGATSDVTPPRTRGRPKGSSAPRRSPSNAGQPPERWGGPSQVEALRMSILDTIAQRMPVAFRLLDDRVLERMENDLDILLTGALEKG